MLQTCSTQFILGSFELLVSESIGVNVVEDKHITFLTYTESTKQQMPDILHIQFIYDSISCGKKQVGVLDRK